MKKILIRGTRCRLPVRIKVSEYSSMITSDQDEIISNFIQLTNADIVAARSYLENCNWQITVALDKYYSGEPVAPPPKPKPVRRASIEDIKETIPPEKPEKLITAGTNTRFTAARSEAASKKRCLVVGIYSKKQPITVLRSPYLSNLFNVNYARLELDENEPDGIWFMNTYNIGLCPFFAIIDSITGELLDSKAGQINQKQAYSWLHGFLLSHPQYGTPIELQLEQLEQQLDSSTSDEDQLELSEEPLDGEKISLMIQFLNGKRSKLEILDSEKVKTLKKRIATLSNTEGDFKLILMPYQELNDMEKTLRELKLNNSLIRMIP